MFTIALNSMLSLFLCMLVGYFGMKKNFITQEMLPMFNKLLLNITFPAMMISILNIELTSDVMLIAPSSLAMGFIYNLLLWFIAIVLVRVFRVAKHKRSILIFSFIFTNVGFIGFPLIGAVYGQEGLLYLSIFNISFNILVFTLGVYILQNDSEFKLSFKKIMTTPVMLAIWFGLFLLLSQLVFPFTFESEEFGVSRLPYFISKSLDMIGDITSPLAMIIVGASLVQTDIIKVFKNVKLHIFALFKLIIAPIFIFLILNPVVDNDMLLSITIVLAGLPTATLSVILAEEFKLDYIFVSEVVFITTLYSVVITPFLFLL